jgi:aspartate/methionine/tyrosine aminotransferase
VLHPTVCGGSHDGLLAVHSPSYRSNLAGYRCGYVAGDPRLVDRLVAVRSMLGLLVPAPQQAVLAAVLGDDEHAREQHDRSARRRARLRDALQAAGFAIDHSEASVHLWASRGEDCWQTLTWLAERGILAAPGELFGAAGRSHVRISFTATDERIDAAAARLVG